MENVIYNRSRFIEIEKKCLENGLNYNTVYARHKRTKLSIDTCYKIIKVATDLGISSHYKPIEYLGNSYINLQHLCVDNDINYNKLYAYLKANKFTSDISAIEMYLNGNQVNLKNKEVVVLGEKYSSINEACENLGIKYNTAYVRHKRSGIALEKCLEIIHLSKKYNVSTHYLPIIVDNFEYINLEHYCLFNEIEYKKLSAYKQKHKLSDLEAIQEFSNPETYRNNKAKKIVVEGTTFKSIKDACIEYDVNYNQVRAREFNSDKELDEIILDLANGVDNRCKPFEFDGTSYKSISEYCKLNDLDYKKFVTFKRTLEDVTIEEAISKYLEQN